MNYKNIIKKELEEKYKYRIEIHAHTTPVSKCSDIPPSDLVKIYKENGYDGVVVTNHFASCHIGEKSKQEYLNWYMENYLESVEEGKKIGLKVYFGIEIRFAENNNDYLIYGADEKILEKAFEYLDSDVKTYRTEVKLPNSVFLQGHPFRNGITCCAPELLDGIEAFNMHLNHNSRNGMAAKYAYENKFDIITAGSDFHHYGQDSVSALRTAVLPETSFDLAKILKSGDYLLELGQGVLVLP